jgi:hypothetical protein
MSAATWKVFTDWNDNGDFTTWGDDVTGRVLDDRTVVSMEYGRDQSRALSPPRIGEAGFEVSNTSGDYSPEKTTSPLYGLVRPARPVKIEATLLGVAYTPFAGRTDDYDIRLDANQRSVGITCMDGLSLLQGAPVTTEMYQGLRTGQALHIILDAIGWPAADRDIDAGATVMPYWWLDGVDAYEAAVELLDSEGPYAMITCDSSRRIVFRDRHHRAIRSRSITSQATWYSRTTEPMISSPATYSAGWRDIVNVVSFDVPMRVQTPELVEVWNAGGRITVQSGETLLVTVKGSGPFLGAIEPVVDVDYQLTGTATLTMAKTSGESTTVSINAPSGSAYIDNLRVRGYLLQEVASIVVAGEDASVGPPRNYGRRTSTALKPPKWAGVYDAQAIVQLILTQRAERLPTVRVTMVAANDTRQLQQLTRDLSDRVRVIAYEMGMDAEFWIEQIEHKVTQGGADHRTTFGMEKAPAQITGAFTIGVSLLGTGVLGRRGFSDPDRIFTLGSATNAVLGTDVLAA